ncbi:MAG: S-adenosylmethionine:tRNA ribosyltransferase-isomerase [Candidatus Omnitrophota bacterium]|nr:S-adenosylmethionine:tRNA ribosyltransferase-isomerase [Candidatus Omnitrophota bacterium]
MKLSEFDYVLPKELIAQYPVKQREKCRLMVLDRASRMISHKHFEDIVGYFNEGDLLVLNDTKVIPARLFGKRKTGGKVELFLLEKKNPVCEALVRPSGRLKEGERIALESGDEVEVLDRGEIGRRVRFSRPLDEILKASGHIPLPPYIDRMDEESDRDDYQTAYAVNEGATASPTAGLHFTRELMERVNQKMMKSLDSFCSSESRDEIFCRKFQGSRVKYITLHTNYGTFAPIKTDDIESHNMHKEYFDLPIDTAKAVVETKKVGGKIFAVGTTTTRVLEYCAPQNITYNLQLSAKTGHTDMFIYPGYNFKVVDHLITNFHLPKSTLMLLVSAFAGRDFIMKAYREAIEKKYRFFSYGDSMIIL